MCLLIGQRRCALGRSRRREAAAGEASLSLEKTVGEPSPWPDVESVTISLCCLVVAVVVVG